VEIIAALSSDSDPALSAAAATTLGLLGDPQAEDALIRLLACENSAVRCAAAKSLGIVGTVHAVEPLLPLTKGLLGDAELRQAAQDAVRRIQGSLGDVEAGRVSVVKVEDVAGALSLTADGGELSLPPEKKREPSS
jgi:HEAT repeat protein